MDDDDYYPPNRISHAVEMLQNNPEALCAGSSIMNIYFKHLNKMYQFGPYGEKHATAATFAFKRKLLSITSFNEEACLAEERHFLKGYTIPFVQLDADKTILVFSHIHNSFNKNELLQNIQHNKFINESKLQPLDMIKQPDILKFFMEDIDELLNAYELGKPENKQDVLKQTEDIRKMREEQMKVALKQQEEYNQQLQKSQHIQENQQLQNKVNELTFLIQQLTLENNELKNKNTYLDNKIKQLITERIQERKKI